MRWILLLLAIGVMSEAAVAEVDEVLNRASALARGGAPRLALQVLESNEPPPTDSKRWIAHERHRVQILQRLKDWPEIVSRADRLPDSLPTDFRRSQLFEAVDAHFALANPDGARRALRRILWQLNPPADQLAHARRLVIRSYLADARLGDAEAALRRYRDEHGQGSSWQVLHAEVLLRQKNFRGAFDVLAGLQSPESRLLRQLAALRGNFSRPADTVIAAEKLAAERGTPPEFQRQAWALVAEAAKASDNTEVAARALEKALAAEAAAVVAGAVDRTLFVAEGSELWEAYERLAERLGNQERLVVGNDDAWDKLARAMEPKRPVGARAIHALQARQASSADGREAAHRRLAASLFKDQLADVAERLYLRSPRYPALADIPVPVRYRLADKALADYNIRVAAELVKDLERPPVGDDDPDGWVLRRARILTYAGDGAGAGRLVSGLIAARPRLDNAFADRVLQVLFDMQSVGAHAEAAPLVAAVYSKVPDPRLQRELLFWQADSQSGLKNHRLAAELYLRSATHNGATGGDPWGHTARYRAGEELAKAGLTRDARDVYTRLLSNTTDPARRTVIERQLQQLWVAEKLTTKP